MRNVLKGQRCLVISSEGNKLLACSDLDVQRKVDQDQITANITDNSASLRLMLLLLLQLACDQITLIRIKDARQLGLPSKLCSSPFKSLLRALYFKFQECC